MEDTLSVYTFQTAFQPKKGPLDLQGKTKLEFSSWRIGNVRIGRYSLLKLYAAKYPGRKRIWVPYLVLYFCNRLAVACTLIIWQGKIKCSNLTFFKYWYTRYLSWLVGKFVLLFTCFLRIFWSLTVHTTENMIAIATDAQKNIKNQVTQNILPA